MNAMNPTAGMYCDFCGKTEEDLKIDYELVEDEEIKWYCVGDADMCEICHDHL